MRLAGIERDLPRGAPPKKVDIARLVELTTQMSTVIDRDGVLGVFGQVPRCPQM
jgi:hypothetical protein